MQSFFSTPGHAWPATAFGFVIGVLCVLAVKRFNKRMDR